MLFTALIAVFGAYLLGSVNFAIIFTKLLTNNDVRSVGSGNAGTTNAFRAGGKVVGTLTFVCDFAKGALSAILGNCIFSYIHSITSSSISKPIYGVLFCGLACMIGHIFPLFFDFKGGKGIATGVGVFMFISPISACIGILVFVICLLISKIVSLSSLVATVVVVVLSLILVEDASVILVQLIVSLIMVLLIFLRHLENIKKIISGTENKFTFGGKNG